MIRHVVTSFHHAQRIDNFLLREHKNVPKSLIYRLFRKRAVKVNQKRVKQDYRLQAGDVIFMPDLVEAPRVEQTHVSPQLDKTLKQAVLYADQDYLIINKPAGLAVHGGSNQSEGLIESIRLCFENATDWELAHRLDRDTSGCVVIAKNRSALLHFHTLQKQKEAIKKSYYALVEGRWPKACHKVDAPLTKTTTKTGHRVRVDSQHGKAALTTFNVEESFGGTATLIKATLKTGRTHQIRVHCQYVGCPIVGDKRYSKIRDFEKSLEIKVPRMFLHAALIQFVGPQGQAIQVAANHDWQGFLQTFKS